MATISFVPNSTATLMNSNAAPRQSPYSRVDVMLVGWQADRINHRGFNMMIMRAICLFLGWNVFIVYGDSPWYAAPRRNGGQYPVPNTVGTQSGCGVFNKFKRILSGGIRTNSLPTVPRERLLIVMYFGHENRFWNGNQNHVYGIGPGTNPPLVNLTSLQDYARDTVRAVDTAFILETCHGGHDGLQTHTITSQRHYTLVETIAGNDGTRTIHSTMGPHNLSRRLAGTLLRNRRYGITVFELFSLVYDRTISRSPGFYRSDGQRNGSILLAPLPNSPAAQELAGQGQIPAALQPAPDALLPRTFQSAQVQRFMASWSDDQRRYAQRADFAGLPVHVIANNMRATFGTLAAQQGHSGAAQMQFIARSIWQYATLIWLLER